MELCSLTGRICRLLVVCSMNVAFTKEWHEKRHCYLHFATGHSGKFTQGVALDTEADAKTDRAEYRAVLEEKLSDWDEDLLFGRATFRYIQPELEQLRSMFLHV